MPTPKSYQAAIIREVGDPSGTVGSLVESMWDQYADKGLISLTLQFLYAKRAFIDARLAEEQPSIDFTVGGDVTDKQSQRFTHLQQMRVTVQEEIVRGETQLGNQRTPRVGVLSTTSPVHPLYGPNPNASVYRGSPLRPRRDPW